MQTVGVYLIVLISMICTVLACRQFAALRSLYRRIRLQQTAYIDAMILLITAVQPQSIREHSRRVADTARNLASQLRLSAERCHLVYIAGLVHELVGVENTSSDPMESSILLAADCFDALINDESMSPDEAIEEIRRGAGICFDSGVVKALIALGAADTIHN